MKTANVCTLLSGPIATVVLLASGALLWPAGAQQSIDTGNGGVFMEEVPSEKKTAPKAEPKVSDGVDLSNVGVPVNSKGRMVPVLQNDGAPMMTSGTNLEVSRTPPVMYAPNYYLNASGQKVDAFGNLLPPGTYLPYTPYALGPGFRANFNSQPGGGNAFNYRQSGSSFGGGGGIGGGFNSGNAGGMFSVPGVTQYSNSGSVTPIFPADQQ